MASITSVSIYRIYMARDDGRGLWADGEHTSYDENGPALYVRAFWRVRGDAAATVRLELRNTTPASWSPSGEQTASKPASSTDFRSETAWLGTASGGLDVDARYDVAIDITAGGKGDSASAYVVPAFRTMDVLEGGRGIAFGTKATEAGLFEVANMNVRVDGDIDLKRGKLVLGSTAGEGVGDARFYVDGIGNLFLVMRRPDVFDPDVLVDDVMVYLSNLGNLAIRTYDESTGQWGSYDYFAQRSDVAPMLVYETVTSGNIGTVAAGSTAWVTAWSVAKTGYKAISIAGYYINGAAALSVYAMRFSDATHVQFAVRNNSSSATSSTAKIEATILYVKTS